MIDGPERCKQGMAGRETARALLPRARRLVLMRTEGCQERAWRKAESGGRGGRKERERACACVSVCFQRPLLPLLPLLLLPIPFSFFASLLFPVLRFVPWFVPPHSFSLFLSLSLSLPWHLKAVRTLPPPSQHCCRWCWCHEA